MSLHRLGGDGGGSGALVVCATVDMPYPTPIVGTQRFDATTKKIAVANGGNDYWYENGAAVAPVYPLTFVPSHGPALLHQVTISGRGFTRATAVKFNGVAATTWGIIDDMTIHADVPAGATSGPVTVTTPAGDQVSALSFLVDVGVPWHDIRVMPLGDQDVLGSAAKPEAWRLKLAQLAQAAGASIDFVGTLENGVMDDADVEAHAGWVLSQLSALSATVFPQTQPDCVVLLAPRNAIGPTTIDDLGPALDAFHANAVDPAMYVFVCTLPPVVDGATDANINFFNAGVDAVVAPRAAWCRKIDVAAAVTVADLDVDGVTLLPAGFDKVAQAIWDVLSVTDIVAPSPGPVAFPALYKRIMPLGDSITAGSVTPGGYRINLANQIRAAVGRAPAGNPPCYVGTQVNGDPATLIDRYHEGHGGYQILTGGGQLGLDDFAVAVLKSKNPDVVILLIGTNDLNHEFDMANMSARLETLLDTVILPNLHVNALVYVCTIPPFGNDVIEPYRDAYNAALPGVVAARPACRFVDACGWMTEADLAPDGIHPGSDAAYDRIGLNIFNKLTTWPRP